MKRVHTSHLSTDKQHAGKEVRTTCISKKGIPRTASWGKPDNQGHKSHILRGPGRQFIGGPVRILKNAQNCGPVPGVDILLRTGSQVAPTHGSPGPEAPEGFAQVLQRRDSRARSREPAPDRALRDGLHQLAEEGPISNSSLELVEILRQVSIEPEEEQDVGG